MTQAPPSRYTRPGVDRAPSAGLLLIPFVIVAANAVLTHASQLPDLAIAHDFFNHAVRILAGLLPYRDFKFEYPPLALVPMTLPHLVPDIGLSDYVWVLALEGALVVSGMGAAILWLARHSWSHLTVPWVSVWYPLLVLALAPLLAWRFDPTVALLTVLGLAAAVRGRHGTAGVLLGLGTLVKIFPVVLVAVLGLWLLVGNDRRNAVRLVGWYVLTGAIVMLPLLIVAGSPALAFLEYQHARGLQIESLPGGIVLLAHVVGGLAVTTRFVFGADEVFSAWNGPILAIQEPVMLAALAGVLVLCALRFREDHATLGAVRPQSVIGYITAMILTLMATDKVLSPQYLMWLLPLGPLLRSRQAFLLVVACALTTVEYPFAYESLVALHPELIAVLNTRNLLLCVLLGWLLIEHAPSVLRRHGDRGRSALSVASLVQTREAGAEHGQHPVAGRGVERVEQRAIA